MFGSACISIKTEQRTPTLLGIVQASQEQLMAEVNRYARVASMSAKMDLKFEDNSFAQFGSKEVYRSADGQVVVQRPASILLKVQVPFIKSDVAQMTSDGERFRVAVLQAGNCSNCKKFVMGTNKADYTALQKNLDAVDGAISGDIKQNVNAFSNLRPQHFTDAMLVRPTSDEYLYAVSTIFQEEEDLREPKKSQLRRVTRGYYLLDEYARAAEGQLVIVRRFWFDRNVKIRLARQQIFDARGELESDITYGIEGKLGPSSEYDRLPLQILVTRPQERYSMRLTYQTPSEVKIGNTYPESAFVLENSWGLEVLDLDAKLAEVLANRPPPTNPADRPNANSSTRFQR